MSSLPTTLGQYQIIREIARSNDIVYEAYDPQMDRRVALKELNLPSGITDAQKEDRIQRFDREAKAAGRLAHPNIMRVFQVANDGERHFMAMEFLDGHTLRNEIDTNGFLPVDRAVEIATAVLKGLSHAHANGVVHRDIKPDNIQLLSSGEIKITDFGIARLTFQPNLTMDGQVFGTPSYMSPEQVVGKEIDARSDLFSVGVLLYEMISGTKPFGGDSVVAITYAIMNAEPEPLKQVNHSMWQVISRALDKSPALRYSSAQEMIDALEQATSYSVVLDSPAPPPGQTIYGPVGGGYPAPPPVINPYGQPQQTYGGAQAPMPAPPPIVYPYNPYQTGGGAMPPHTPGFPQQGYPQVPVYYPPPKPKVYIKPETKHFIGKLLLTLLVMGTAVAVLLMIVAALGQALSEKQAHEQDQKIVLQMDQVYGSAKDNTQKIEELEQLIPKLTSQVTQGEQKRRLAELYEKLGNGYIAGNNGNESSLVAAEDAYTKALRLDANNPQLMQDLAQLYTTFAESRQSPDDRMALYGQSLKMWKQAADRFQADSNEQLAALSSAGDVYYNMANYVSQFGDAYTETASDYIREGLGITPESTSQGRIIRQKLENLDNRLRQMG